MRIALLGTRGIPANYGGFETFAEELSVRLAARGHEVTVYCREKYRSSVYRGVHLRYLPTVHNKYLDTLAHTFLSTLHLVTHRPDCALYCNAANAIFLVMTRLTGIPVALNVDGIERKRKKWNWFARTWYRMSEYLATVLPQRTISDAKVIERYYQERYGKETTFIPYGAETFKLESDEMVRQLGLEPGKYFLYVSRMEPENHALQVRQAFEQVPTALKLALIGDAPHAAEYIRDVRATSDPRIVMPGGVYGLGYHELGSHCFAYVHATEVGGTHPALIEAMGKGALVLYRNTPENVEVCGDAGLPFADEAGLVARMREAIAMPEAQRELYRRRAEQTVRDRYDWDLVTRQYERLFEEMCPVTGPALRTWASVSLRQLRLNFHAIQQSVGSQVALAPVVKANAYGHGAAAVSRALAGAGAKWLAVSCVSEGMALRQSGITTRILVMGGLLPFEREPVWTHRLTPVIHSLEELREWDLDGRSLDVHLKIDTGMSRLGATASPGEVAQSLRVLSHIRVEGLMSHFAAAEDFTSPQSGEQVRRFEEMWAALQHAGVAPEMRHCSSSNPVVYGRKEAWYSLVRPGLSLYGYVSDAVGGAFPAIEVKPILTWQARLLKVKEIVAGTPVGYMARFRAPCAMRVGTVAAGYADGVPHRLSTRGVLMSEGRALPILGAVSMDLTTVDLNLAPELQEGDAVTILGDGMDAARIAVIAGEIPYSVLCGIGNRVRRVYSEE